jgi:hypothetical protein
LATPNFSSSSFPIPIPIIPILSHLGAKIQCNWEFGGSCVFCWSGAEVFFILPITFFSPLFVTFYPFLAQLFSTSAVVAPVTLPGLNIKKSLNRYGHHFLRKKKRRKKDLNIYILLYYKIKIYVTLTTVFSHILLLEACNIVSSKSD